ncbi:MAG TPA: serine/threonine-protein kinase [Gemmatimonadales bacterium]
MAVTVEQLQEALDARYRVGHKIGRGAMATVFLAWAVEDDRQVAIKVLRPEFAMTMGSERFHREIEILHQLDHPNILPLIESNEAGSLLYYVTPYATGDLEGRLADAPQLPLDDALEITRQVAAALDYAHEHNVLHRDVKPGNILFDGNRVMVCDFGIARAIASAGGDSLSSSGLIIGTPQYMSPEQAQHDKEIDGRADIYSLASVLYEMLVGQPPFTGPTVQAVLSRITKERPPAIRVVRPDVPEHVEAAIYAALAKRPEERPARGRDFTRRLQARG